MELVHVPLSELYQKNPYPIRNRTIEITDKLYRYFVFPKKIFKITKYTGFTSKNSIIENDILATFFTKVIFTFS